jgi:hypothetical protein
VLYATLEPSLESTWIRGFTKDTVSMLYKDCTQVHMMGKARHGERRNCNHVAKLETLRVVVLCRVCHARNYSSPGLTNVMR